MTTFDERERSFENLFAHDAEQHFKATARRNWLLGIWAAEKMGFDAERTKKYATDLVALMLEPGADHDVVEKVALDLATLGDSISALPQARAACERFDAQARQEFPTIAEPS